jgi:hypothetical protein
MVNTTTNKVAAMAHETDPEDGNTIGNGEREEKTDGMCRVGFNKDLLQQFGSGHQVCGLTMALVARQQNLPSVDWTIPRSLVLPV